MSQYSPDYFVFGIKELVDPERRTEIRLNANVFRKAVRLFNSKF
jgi:hypothetical protein